MAELLGLGLAGLALLYGLHRLALWAEDRGWIYYTRKHASPDTLGNAMLNLQRLVQPNAEHVLTIKKEERAAESRQGDGTKPDAT